MFKKFIVKVLFLSLFVFSQNSFCSIPSAPPVGEDVSQELSNAKSKLKKTSYKRTKKSQCPIDSKKLAIGSSATLGIGYLAINPGIISATGELLSSVAAGSIAIATTAAPYVTPVRF